MRYHYAATVTKVIDGDTVDLDVDLGLRTHVQTRFRLSGIDAPERATEAGKTTKAWLVERIEGKQVEITTHKDATEKYGRWMAAIFLGGVNVNMEMVDKGLARYYDGGRR